MHQRWNPAQYEPVVVVPEIAVALESVVNVPAPITGIMLALFSSSLSFQAPGMVAASATRAAVSMQTGAMSDTFVYGAPAPLGTIDLNDVDGKVVPTGRAVVAAPAAAPKAPKPAGEPSMSWNFIYGRFEDSSVGPPCGVTHHQGSGTGPGQTMPGYKNGKPYVRAAAKSAPSPAVETAVALGNCAGDECQIG